MQPLPIDSAIPEILSSLRSFRSLILVAEPGAGKTTRIPPALDSSGMVGPGQIVVLEPRRLAAETAARRIAYEQEWTLGKEVGYQIRFENRTTRETRIRIATEGILLRELQSDPFLENVGAIILDEFHERSQTLDLLLGLLVEIRSTREDLFLIVMSATLDAQAISQYLANAPIIDVKGHRHPVAVEHFPVDKGRFLDENVAGAIQEYFPGSQGNTLVFLPGIGPIRRTRNHLLSHGIGEDTDVPVLHGGLPASEQKKALSPGKKRKIILATNVAETSITVPGVDLVIDSGYHNILRHDPTHGIDRLVTERISLASADQRTGRAGRTGPGKAVRLWSLADQARMDQEPTPEIQRVDLASAVLELRAWGVNKPEDFKWFEAPPSSSLKRGEKTLHLLGAIHSETGAITPRGKAMARLPTHPRLGAFLLEAHRIGCLRQACIMAAFLSERDIFLPDGGREKGKHLVGPSDLLHRLEAFEEAAKRNFHPSDLRRLCLHPNAIERVSRSSRQLARVFPKNPKPSSKTDDQDETLRRALLQAYPDRVARRRGMKDPRGRLVGGRGVRLLSSSIVTEGEFFLAIEVSGGGTSQEAKVRTASEVDRKWIEEDLSHLTRMQRETTFDIRREKVICSETLFLLDLPLEEPRERKPDPQEAEQILREQVAEHQEKVMQSDPGLSSWLTRVACLRNWRPDLDLPDFNVEKNAQILGSACSGKASFKELQKQGLLALFSNSIRYDSRSAIDRLAPETMTVPSGSKVRLEYRLLEAPILAVRLQEMFGLKETPSVAGGRVPVLLHLLGPNFRPVQVTQDLASFWNNTYSQVRKDLRGRYPKHSWPEDPLIAEPTRRTRRK